MTPDGRLVSGSHESIKVWDVSSGKCQLTLEGHSGWGMQIYRVNFYILFENMFISVVRRYLRSVDHRTNYVELLKCLKTMRSDLPRFMYIFLFFEI